MTDKNKITIHIYGQDYVVRSDDTEEFILKVANYVDDKMRKLAKSNALLSYQKIAVLTALNIADEYHKLLEQNGLNAPTIDDRDLDTKEKIENLTIEVERNSNKYQDISQQFEQLIDNSASYETELENLKQKLKALDDELAIKEREIKDKEQQLQSIKETAEIISNDETKN